MKPKSLPTQPAHVDPDSRLASLFAGLFGAMFGLALLKFGTPVIMEHFVQKPREFLELIFTPWPILWGYMLLGIVAAFGLAAARRRSNVPLALLLLPAIWLGWQVVSASQTVSMPLTRPTVIHFAACVACFYLGFYALSRAPRSGSFWAGITIGFLIVIAVGLRQHFGGLEETRRFFYLYVYPQVPDVPPEYLAKLSSNRIFSTLFYPNSLAGVILLFLPAVAMLIWRASRDRFTVGARRFLVGIVAAGALGCLYWSGSKGGWLLLLFMGLVALLHLKFERRWKLALVGAVLVLGLAGFFWRYAGFFQRGAASVGARFDYWQAAADTAFNHPVFGTGPGTFFVIYQQVKRPESEMTRLAHNDYLQQASDSGIPGFLLYVTFVGAVLAQIYRHAGVRSDPFKFAVWLGLLGWSLQGLTEFGLYTPALAWPTFGLFGWLLGQTGKPIDKPPPSR